MFSSRYRTNTFTKFYSFTGEGISFSLKIVVIVERASYLHISLSRQILFSIKHTRARGSTPLTLSANKLFFFYDSLCGVELNLIGHVVLHLNAVEAYYSVIVGFKPGKDA